MMSPAGLMGERGGAGGSLWLLYTLTASDLPQKEQILLPDGPVGIAGAADACSELGRDQHQPLYAQARPRCPGHSWGLTCLLPACSHCPAHLQPGPCQCGDQPGKVST